MIVMSFGKYFFDTSEIKSFGIYNRYIIKKLKNFLKYSNCFLPIILSFLVHFSQSNCFQIPISFFFLSESNSNFHTLGLTRGENSSGRLSGVYDLDC